MKKRRLSTLLIAFLKIILGSAAFAAGFQLFLYPNSIITGGVTGLSMIINYITHWPVGILTFAINLPLFIISWKALGKFFLIGSAIGTIILSTVIDLLASLGISATHEPLLASVYGGLLCGVGMGTVFSAGASTGGSDIIAKLVRLKLPYLNIGQIVLAVDVVIIALFAVTFRTYDSAMYSAIAMFISSKVTDGILYGFDFSKAAYIISSKSEEISQVITVKLGRGVTVLYGKGAYSGEPKNVLLCAIKRNQIVELKRAVKSIDSSAFIIITEAREVLGQGFQDIDTN